LYSREIKKEASYFIFHFVSYLQASTKARENNNRPFNPQPI